MSRLSFTSNAARNRTMLGAAVIAATTLAFWWGGVPGRIQAGLGGSNRGGAAAGARAGQITTMVARFNQFLPGGAQAIQLVDGKTYSSADFAQLVTAGYCADTDLENQMGGDWTWNGTTRKFEPQTP